MALPGKAPTSRPHRLSGPVGRALALALAASASAALLPAATVAQPFTLTSQRNVSRPHVAVDNAGNGHFVWQEEAFLAGGEPIHYCRVPRGGRACAVQQSLSAGDAGLGLHVFSPAPNVVVIVSHRCCSLRPAPNGQNRAARTVMGQVSQLRRASSVDAA